MAAESTKKPAKTTKSEKEFSELDSFLGADISVEDMPFGSTYAVLQWLNGRPNGKDGTIQQTGGFFMSADQGVEPPPGFEPFTLISDEGDEVPGFAAQELTFSPIQFRRCWEIGGQDDDGSRSQRFAWSQYDMVKDSKPRGLTHIIISIEGADEPYLLTVRGTSARAMMGMGRDQGVIPRYGQKIVAAAKRISRKKKGAAKNFPLCAFQLTVGPSMKDGKPDYIKVGSGSQTSTIVQPDWKDEPEGLVTEAHIARLFVGHERFAANQDIHREVDEWSHAWDEDVLNGGTSSSDQPAPAEGAEGGVPGAQSTPF